MRVQQVRRSVLLALTALAMVSSALVVAPAKSASEVDRTAAVGGDRPETTWEGPAETAANTGYDEAAGGPCGKNFEDYCDLTLLEVDLEPTFWNTHTGGVTVHLGEYQPNPASDFDLFIYESDEAGNRGKPVGSSGNEPGLPEDVTIPNASGHYLVVVVYFATTASSYTGSATLEVGEAAPTQPTGEEAQYYFHSGGPQLNQADKVFGDGPFFDANPPEASDPSYAADTSLVGNSDPGGIGNPTWTGTVNGPIETLELDFWQKSPVGEALIGEVNYEVTVWVGDTAHVLPAFNVTANTEETPTRVSHLFTPENSGGKLPLDPAGQPVTIDINGVFIDAEVGTVIVYDSVEFPSGLSVNVPIPGLPVTLDIDAPKGLQEYLASDPSKGFRSHSEPHIAQSPVDPNVLVAGSKMYNLDSESLDEYEFKIGTYVSFDGGRAWTDLGQIGVCPADDPVPESINDNTHTCYPPDDPARDGTGEEDGSRGGGEDVGEEYITSDVWMQFDDEGNAYTMVLDAPDLGVEGGWGMSFHRWESVSPEDLETGNTWSERIPINAYPDSDSIRRDVLGFLDDKNTFAVNNAGPDGDGETGTIISCWGQSISAAIKQQIVCERSTDGGRTWPDEPVVISGAQHLVIGVDVVADTQDPDTFYATWAQYATGGGAGDIGGELTPETLELAKTTDGGQTWQQRSVPITTMTGIPRQFPGQRFRNLTLPIMAVGPDGELYITYADYLDAPDARNDEDGKQADIMLVKSTDGGESWSEPKNLTADTGPDTNPNADQFQPYVAVTPAGQVNVSYFDRRMDLRTDTNPGNYFVDTYLSRSNDGGETFTDIRLSHDLSDPEHNAPVDSGGRLFFGDYQGLVADDCAAIPFVNDAHRALNPKRDPAFDHDMPTSDFQEVFAWRVPNTPELGGGESTCPPDLVVTPSDIQVSGSGRFRELSGTVHNTGLTSASNVLVLFEVEGREVALRRIGSLAPGDATTVSVIWDTRDQPGDYAVTVAADPDARIDEADETNNKSGMTVRIERPHSHTTAGRRPA